MSFQLGVDVREVVVVSEEVEAFAEVGEVELGEVKEGGEG